MSSIRSASFSVSFVAGLCAIVVPIATARAQAPDLSVWYVRTNVSTVRAGQTITVSYDVRNLGGPTPWGAIGWQDGVYLRSTAAAPSASAPPLVNRFVNVPWSMQNGFSYSGYNWNPPINQSITVRIPTGTAPGTYHIGYFANRMRSDGWLNAEVNYSNNYLTRVITVEGPPDLDIPSLTAPTTPWLPGTTAPIDLTVRNRGGTVGNVPCTLSLFLSSTTAPQGLPIATFAVPAIAMNAQLPFQGIAVTVPAATPFGRWNLVAFVDSANVVAELSETDNTRAAPVTIGPAASASGYGVGCASRVGVPTIGAANLPRLGSTDFAIAIGNLFPWTLLGLQLGFSNQQWNGQVLPLSLASRGLPGCFLLQDLQVGHLANNGVDTGVHFGLPIPNAVTLVGVRVFAQGIVHDPLANAAGLAMTAGLDVRIGY